MSKDKKNLETAYKELQELVKDFESGTVKLEQAPKKFSEGVALAKFLKSKLKEIENQVEEIKQGFEEEAEK